MDNSSRVLTNEFQLANGRWDLEKAKSWKARQPFTLGCNYLPRYAINQIDMWENFDPVAIDEELAIMERDTGGKMNVLRVFLHDLCYEANKNGFKEKVKTFLDLCEKHRMRMMPVFFDSCWDPYPQLGPQRAPLPGVHNSGWVQSPGAPALKDPAQMPRLEAYVKDMIGNVLGRNKNVYMIDLYNEPCNDNRESYGRDGINTELPSQEKCSLVINLLRNSFHWARSVPCDHPLTSAPWIWPTDDQKLSQIERTQFGESDVITVHNYDGPAELARRLEWVKQYTGDRPADITEYMARTLGSTFESTLPLCLARNVGAINWGSFAGRSQTFNAWGKWNPNDGPFAGYDVTTVPWTRRAGQAEGVCEDYVCLLPPTANIFHDIWGPNGKPIFPREVDYLRNLPVPKPLSSQVAIPVPAAMAVAYAP